MKYKCSLFVVKDIKRSRDFYEKVLGQTVKYDFGENVTFQGDFAIQESSHFATMIRIDKADISSQSNNSELYFEEENIDDFLEKLESLEEEIHYIHKLIEHPWGQRVIRFYDPDKHIIEVGESMETVARRFISKGYSVEETSKIIQHPVDFVKKSIGMKSFKTVKVMRGGR